MEQSPIRDRIAIQVVLLSGTLIVDKVEVALDSMVGVIFEMVENVLGNRVELLVNDRILVPDVSIHDSGLVDGDVLTAVTKAFRWGAASTRLTIDGPQITYPSFGGCYRSATSADVFDSGLHRFVLLHVAGDHGWGYFGVCGVEGIALDMAAWHPMPCARSFLSLYDGSLNAGQAGQRTSEMPGDKLPKPSAASWAATLTVDFARSMASWAIDGGKPVEVPLPCGPVRVFASLRYAGQAVVLERYERDSYLPDDRLQRQDVQLPPRCREDQVTKIEVLDEVLEEDYEPVEQKIEDYAEWIGMDLDRDRDLLWIAREGLKAPLPDNWKPCQSEGGEIFYFNFSTGENVWDHPCDAKYKDMYEREKNRKEGRNRTPQKNDEEKSPRKDDDEAAADEAIAEKAAATTYDLA